nr:uncharacterized protein LOC131777616 [Pocillopora verrucosa]
MANSNSNANDQDRFVSTDRDDLMDTFSQFLILDLEVPDDTPTMQTSRMLAQVIFESQQMRSQGEMETIPVQPSWLMDSSVAMVSYSNFYFTLKYRQCTKLTSEFRILSLTVF